MSSTRPASPQKAGLSAALVVVRLVMALLERLFADAADLPENHPDRRLLARARAELARAEARILANIAMSDRAAARAPNPPHAARAPLIQTVATPARTATCPAGAIPRIARAPPMAHTSSDHPLIGTEPPLRRLLSRAHRPAAAIPRKGSAPFLKKRSKKLFSLCRYRSQPSATRTPTAWMEQKVFLVLFVHKKNTLPHRRQQV